MEMFRELSQQEEDEFRQWARDNYEPFSAIKEGIWHPIVVEECQNINKDQIAAEKRSKYCHCNG